VIDSDETPDLAPLERVKEIEDYLTKWRARTAMGAEQLLEICIAILNHDGDPEEHLSQGPVIEILKNPRATLNHASPDRKLATK